MARRPRPSTSAPASFDESFLDDTVYAYVDWREACTIVQDTYAKWSAVTADERRFAFWLYREALDGEEHASRVYADRVTSMADALESHTTRDAG